MNTVLGLCQTICIKEHGIVIIKIDFLLFESHFLDNSQRKVRNNLEHFFLVSEQYRGIMTGISEPQMAG